MELAMPGVEDDRSGHRVLPADQAGELARREYTGYSGGITGQSYGLLYRWGVYRLTENPVDYYEVAFKELQTKPTDTILDVGCSDGIGLLRKRMSTGHVGPIIGVDIDPSIFEFAKSVNDTFSGGPIRPVQFIAAEGEHLPLPDNSVDGATALFMLYHAAKPARVLTELRRVLRPDGRLVVATSGPENKSRHREFEQNIAKFLGIEPPPIFTSTFDTVVADEELPKYFEVEKVIEQHADMEIKPAEKWNGKTALPPASPREAYLNSLASMRQHFSPEPGVRKWQLAIREIVESVIGQDIAEHGQFTDKIDRKLYVLRNTMKNIVATYE